MTRLRRVSCSERRWNWARLLKLLFRPKRIRGAAKVKSSWGGTCGANFSGRSPAKMVPGCPGHRDCWLAGKTKGWARLLQYLSGEGPSCSARLSRPSAGKQLLSSASSPDGEDFRRSCAQRRAALQVGAASWCDASTLSRWAPRETKRKPGANRIRSLGDGVEYQGRSYPNPGSRARVRQLRQ